jgi:hypothetical protein
VRFRDKRCNNGKEERLYFLDRSEGMEQTQLLLAAAGAEQQYIAIAAE